ncbi:MAG: helix-turn-helix domain-containing protein [Hydrococcus sp. Prado102]|nr:helix-turn-helix domain-containing protein [Hydrococcus sp. Prado102]
MKQEKRCTVSSLEKLIISVLSNSKDLRPEYRRRLEIILRTKMGQSQAEICAALGCSQDTARYWMTIAQTEQADKYVYSLGRPKTVNEQYLERLKELASNNPRDFGYPFRKWTAQWLGKHLAKEIGIEISDRHINRLLKQMGLSTRNSSQAGEQLCRKNFRIAIGDLQPSRSA